MSPAIREDPTELQARWRAVSRHFRAWTLLIDLFFDPGSYAMWGADLITSVLRSKRSRAAAGDLEGASPETLSALAEMARVNVGRTGDLFRNVAVCYISLPIALLALLSDAAPDQLRQALTAVAPVLGNIIVALVVSPIIYWLGHWRAKQIGWTIDLVRVGALVATAKKSKHV